MPKEMVYGNKPYDGKWFDTQTGVERDVYVPIQSVVDVRWNRETGTIELGTHAIDSITGGELYEWPAELKKVFGHDEPDKAMDLDRHNEIRETEETLLKVWNGYWVQLDRRAVNELIRKLRRARDQAFGRDE